MINITILVDLQKIYDEEQNLKRKSRESQDSLLVLKKQLDLISKEKKDTDEQIHQLKVKLSEENFKLQTEETSLKKYNHELYTTHESNPRYLKDVETKIQELSKLRETEEETIIFLMDDLEQLTKKQNLVNQQEKEIQEAYEMKLKSHDSVEFLIKEDQYALSLNKKSLREQINSDALEVFDEMMLKCQGKALAILSKGECSVCRFLIPLSQTDVIKKNRDELHFCSNCKRILIAI